VQYAGSGDSSGASGGVGGCRGDVGFGGMDDDMRYYSDGL